MTAGKRLTVLAVWVALAAGLTEVLLRHAERLTGRFNQLGPAISWMAPLNQLLLLTLAAAILLLLARVHAPAAGMRTATAVFVTTAAFSVGLLQPWIAWWAVGILALAVGVRAGAFAAAHEAGTLRFAGRTIPVLAAGVLVAAGLAHVRPRLAERRALASLPVARPAAPNVLLIIWDTVRAASTSLFGNPHRTTPVLESLATRGAVFERAMATASWTLPSHASLFTGRYPHQLSASWLNPLDDETPTLAEALAAHGYRTAGFSANRIYGTREHGLQRGFSRYDDFGISFGELLRSGGLTKRLFEADGMRRFLRQYARPGRRFAPEIRDEFFQWLDRGGNGHPFFAFLNIFDAHEPYLPPAPFDTMFLQPGHGRSGLHETWSAGLGSPLDLSQDQVARQLEQYEGAIASIDHDLGVLIEGLRRRGALDNTIVIVASDHGEAFGEHRTFSHGNDLYQNVLHVPLVVWYPPSVPAGTRVGSIVSLRDLPATIGDLTGTADSSWRLEGRSLARYWQDSGAGADTILAEIDQLPRGGEPWYAVSQGDVRSIIADPWQLIVVSDSSQLFDLRADPDQRRDLARDIAGRPTQDVLRAALRQRRRDAVATKH